MQSVLFIIFPFGFLLTANSNNEPEPDCIRAVCGDFVNNCAKCNCIDTSTTKKVCSKVPSSNVLPCFNDRDSFTIECTQCEEDAFLDPARRCNKCSDYNSYCKKCQRNPDGLIHCLTCDHGFTLNKTNTSQCLNCRYLIPNCLECTSSTSPFSSNPEYVCTICRLNYIVTAQGTCSLCSDVFQNCNHCQGLSSKSVCMMCNVGYGLVPASATPSKVTMCMPCNAVIPGCIICSFESMSSAICWACSEGMQLVAKDSCIDCKQIDPYCISCTPGPKSVCTECSPGMKFTDGRCRSCLTISGGCEECTYGVQAHCTRCKSGFYLTNSNTETECVLCSFSIPKCKECQSIMHIDNSIKIVCLRCEDGYFLTADNRCQRIIQKLKGCKKYQTERCEECRYGYCLINGSCAFCRALSLGCLDCIADLNSKIRCLKCLSGFYLKEGGCFPCSEAVRDCRTCISRDENSTAVVLCTECKVGSYINTTINKCVFKTPNCISFIEKNGRMYCQACLKNYRLIYDTQGDFKCQFREVNKAELWSRVGILIILFFAFTSSVFIKICHKSQKCLIPPEYSSDAYSKAM